MTEGQKRNRALELLGPLLIVASIGGGAGATVQAHFDTEDATKASLAASGQLKATRDEATAREARLNAIIDQERKENAAESRKRDVHFASFSAHAIRVQHALETDLSDSRRTGDACSGRIAAIAEDVGELDRLLSESVGLLEAGQGEIGQLKGENGRLAAQVVGWQQRYVSEHPERVTVTGAKP